MSMQNYTIDQLMLFIGGVGTTGIALILALQKSKCKTISLCCFKCERDVRAVVESEHLQVDGHTGETPRLSLNQSSRSESVSKKELSSESEPAVEP